MTFWVGLTGGIGSGKSQAAAEFLYLGVPVIDVDAVSRELTADNGKALSAIRAAFGSEVFNHDGRLNRAVLRGLVFRGPEAKTRLESIMFPLILSEVRALQESCVTVYGIIDIPLLIEKPAFLALVDRVLVIDVSEQTQIERVRSRSGLKADEIERIMATQACRKERLLAADDVLTNEGISQALAAKVRQLHGYYQSRFSYLSRVTS
ncbi:MULTISPECIES: dephospho-CoA kinase [unclassified Neisseria]|uniref:dephospho-CoA kinase n=1 Tax=unclassified Neisseria TaxID=2623750 RepID=UPI0026668964|nr:MULTISPECIES: dephospho-CoA kinase [unclassified Neisseria]MDO1509575.1 dephospho-CoA kinase [Neisseria sp. MVDL19-042950]MDO1515653.1 dephospho-CoA kinase [Neisseria sp. MVDL18-041461]MDO1564078.1 dephospho-CoA kinase [Neisseria sp. MVDL20-010259]